MRRVEPSQRTKDEKVVFVQWRIAYRVVTKADNELSKLSLNGEIISEIKVGPQGVHVRTFVCSRLSERGERAKKQSEGGWG